MRSRHTDAAQKSYVTQGLALAVLELGVTAVTSGKVPFEFAFAHAWRRFPAASDYPTVQRRYMDARYMLISRNESRRGPLWAAWGDGQWLEPYIAIDGWTLQDGVDLLCDTSQTPWPHWQQLGCDFIDDLERQDAGLVRRD